MMQNNARRSTDIDGKRGYLFPGFSSEACIAAEFVYYASEDGMMDYYASTAIGKIDEYLARDTAMMVFRGARTESLPVFDEYLAEWGFAFAGTSVLSPEESLSSAAGEGGNRLVATYPDADTAAVGYSMFSDLLQLATPPKTVLEDAGSLRATWKTETVVCAENVTRYAGAAFYAGEKAKVYDKDGYLVPTGGSSVWFGAIASEAQLIAGEYKYSYVFASGSEKLVTNEYLGDPSLGNGDVIFALLRTISRTDVYASNTIGGFDMNANYGGKMFDETHLSAGDINEVWYGLEYYKTYKGMTVGAQVFMHVAVLLVPLTAVALLGFAVLRKRENPTPTVTAPSAPAPTQKDGSKKKGGTR
jgi:hypothetical protein